MEKSVFDFENHEDYLGYRLDPRRNKRGVKAEFSAFLRIQPAYLSQVLAKKFALSLEQADLANRFFDHTTEEANFFILLVSKDRSATHSLKTYYDQQITAILKKRLLISERIGKRNEVTEEAKGRYYSSWLYAGVHVAATLDSIGSQLDIAKQLQVPSEIVSAIIDFLIENQLLLKKENKFEWANSWVRIDKNSPHIVKHHTNWRLKAIQNLELQTENDLHYSGIFSMSKKTANQIKSQLMDAVKENLKLIEDSAEQDVYVLNADFFSILNKNS